ncbi:MAG: ABC transporter permease [Myxococcales bacterium]|nr:ABC transporter permease [Myxococcales bacterium]
MAAASSRSGSVGFSVLGLLKTNGRAQLGLGILGLFVVVGVIGPLFIDDAGNYVAIPYLEPSFAHLFGTTGQGQDVLAQTIVGTRASLFNGLIVGIAVVMLGAAVGVTAGYFGGWIDDALSLAVNVLLVVPSLPLAIVIAAYLPPGPFTVGIVLIGTGWAWNARVLRVQTLSLRERDYVLAARVAGEPHWRIIFVEMLPNMGPILLTQLVGATTYAIGAQVGLEFLGLGDVGAVTWGSNLYWASNDQALLTGAWWTFVPTGTCIALVGFALSLLNTSVDEATNPALRVERSWRVYLKKMGVLPGMVTPVVRP